MHNASVKVRKVKGGNNTRKIGNSMKEKGVDTLKDKSKRGKTGLDNGETP
jgi:hypothetical protein